MAMVPQGQFGYIDSLYTYAYIRHRILKSFERFSIPARVRQKLSATAAVAEGLAARAKDHELGDYQYLIDWVGHPEWDEDEAMRRGQAGAARGDEQVGCCLSDSTGYAAFQQQITDWRIKAYAHEQKGELQQVMRYRDSVVRNTTFLSNDLILAKRLAVKVKDTGWYLRFFIAEQYRSFSDQAKADLVWPLATTAEARTFVKASLARVDMTQKPPRQEPVALRLLVNRFETLHDLASKSILAAYRGAGVLLHNKNKLRGLYCFLVTESYTTVPLAFCQYASGDERIPPAIGWSLGYFSLHLIQLNSFGRHYPPELFESYFTFLRCLAYNRNYDMESYADYYDSYLTAVMHRETMFGSVFRAKGFGSQTYKESPEAVANRRLYHLLPISIIRGE